MPRAVGLVRDLMFGSRLQGSLRDSDVTLELVGDEQGARERLAFGDERPGVLVVDLTDPDVGGIAALEAMRADGTLAGVRTIAFYSHVDASVRERALSAGFDLVVPRSRMAREASALIARAG
jgi:CheY-like chemotaxis protein